jgi:predicted GNAT family N-acyltransferase
LTDPRLTRQQWLELIRRTMEGAWRTFARFSGARTIAPEGVFGELNPTLPERSVFNGVVYSDPGALEAGYEELARAYAEHGCAWTVWVPEDDSSAAALLERAGHKLDAEPRAMGLGLSGLKEPALEGIQWTANGDHEAMCRLNDWAYGYEEGTWRRGMGRSVEGLRIYMAYLDGEPVATVAALDVDGDCSIWNVATAAAARGRGLCGALMRRAVWDGAQRGRATSTLQATKLGTQVYARVGYGDFGALQMWEYRPPELADA